ncbi:hypothetical protein PybrP1_012432 [[Pythium] brassicae (nom. inval.)]|nr:hypothetical protein PybrP1_012432 [[Pythium] brassicae (nom. inval.)]
MRATLLLALLFAAAAMLLVARADPREVENAEFKEEFGEEFDEHVTHVADADARVELLLEHNIPSAAGAFSPRGKVEIVLSASLPKPKVTFVDLPAFSSDDIRHLEQLLAADRHYSVRARSDPSDPTSPYVMASIPMCMLAGTRMRENFAFHLSDDGKLRDMKSVKFGAFGSVFKAQSGPSPPKQIAAKKERAPKGVKPIKAEDEPAEEAESQSFLRKYWYVVLPLVLFSLFGSDGGSAAPSAGGAAAPAAGGGARRR